MKTLTKIKLVIFTMFIGLLFAGSASAANELTTMVTAVSFADLIAALLALFGLFAGVGVIMKGGNAVTRKLGFK